MVAWEVVADPPVGEAEISSRDPISTLIILISKPWKVCLGHYSNSRPGYSPVSY